MESPPNALADDVREREYWRLGFQQSGTLWHQLTTLIVSCTNLSLTVASVILTSGTLKNLHVMGSALTEDSPSPVNLQEFLSAMEAHCSSLTLFSCTFCKDMAPSDIQPTLDHLLPFLTSCTNLTIHTLDLTSIGPLLSLTRLESLKIHKIYLDGGPGTGFQISDLQAFIEQEKGVLRYLDITHFMDGYGVQPSTLGEMQKLKEQTRSLNIEFCENRVPL